MKSINRNYKKTKKFIANNFWWFVFSACLLLLLIYGLSSFTAKPTVETITTHAPGFNTNSDQMREVNFQSNKKMRRR